LREGAARGKNVAGAEAEAAEVAGGGSKGQQGAEVADVAGGGSKGQRKSPEQRHLLLLPQRAVLRLL
jgi:hypothetical protein